MTDTPGNAVLFPLNGQPDAPTLRMVRGGRLLAGAEGSGRTREVGIGGDGAVALARYTTTVRNPRAGAGDRHRVGWQLLDRTGQVLVWLGNSERPMYDTGQAQAFAASAGLRCAGLGEVAWADLQRVPAEARIGGPGTSRAGSVVAPMLQWALCLVVIGGPLMVEGPTVLGDFSASASGADVLLAIGRVVLGILGGIFVAKFLGRFILCYREDRAWRRRRSAVLRSARRLPALSITTEYGQLVVRDLERRHQVGTGQGIALQQYRVPPGSRRGPAAAGGLLIRDPRKVALEVPAEFDAGEVAAFAARISASVLQPETDPRQLPVRPKGRRTRPVRVGRAWWRHAGLGVQVVCLLSPALVAVAVARAAGVPLVPGWLAWELGGLAALTIGSWLLVRAQAPAWVVRPRTVAEPVGPSAAQQ